MKRSILLIIAVLLTLSVSAQKEDVIASAGNYDESTSISLSWTLGEAFLPVFVGDQLMLTPTTQPTLFVTAVEETILPFVEVKVFPNPTSEFVRIAFEDPLEVEIDLFLLDLQGKLLLRDFIETASSEKIIDMRSYDSGVYLLRLVQGKLSNVYRIVKI
jgi:hypothetical protein